MKYIVAQKDQIFFKEKELGTLGEKDIRVKVKYSAISPGTELSIKNANQERAVQLGYSAAGEVSEVGSQVTQFKVGDKVACYGGPYVHHAEELKVPETLCVRVPVGVSLKEAATAGLGAIALHALRKVQVTFGEKCAVVGLGIFGQLISQTALAAGMSVYPLNRSNEKSRILQDIIHVPCYSDEDEMTQVIKENDISGVDHVFLCTGKGTEYLNDLGMDWLIDKGNLVLVGDIDPVFNRPKMFAKEIDVHITRAGGPGRYDPSFEKDAVDYPIGYVRWTESKNMSEYLRLISEKKINIQPYIEDEVYFKDVEIAYEELENRSYGSVFTKLISYS